MKIGVDFDDVLLDSYASLLAYHNHHYGTTNQPGDIRDWHIQHTWNCSSEEALRRVEEWYGTAWHEQIAPIPGARTVIEKLAKRHELHVITGRPAQVAEMTRRQACEHFPGVFKEVHLTSHFKANARSKGDVCRALGVELMIEGCLAARSRRRQCRRTRPPLRSPMESGASRGPHHPDLFLGRCRTARPGITLC